MRPFLDGERSLEDLRLTHRPTAVLQRYVAHLERSFAGGRADLRDYVVYVAVKDLLRRRTPREAAASIPPRKDRRAEPRP